MISNTVIVLLIGFIAMSFKSNISLYVSMVWGASLSIAIFYDWFNICMTLNKDKRGSE